ncbi:sensor histidine kinase [Pseudomonas sp. Irchel 3A7]|uniref:sensor histidine kinase n=1 Tax=Pseudomonas sp. Irchel 3A7 TaxID=2008913 RepID=UPI000BA332F1|nr:sensor histidine kinase [Pseudomonas sp. Irchel 3A7]
MDRAEAFKAMQSNLTHLRFTAVRALERTAVVSDIPILLKLKSAEHDFHVKKRLEVLISKLSILPELVVEPEDTIPTEVRQKLRSEAIEWVAGLLLHEIGSKLGLLASAVAQEIPNYQLSHCKRRIEALQDTFDGIEELKKATSVPRPIDMDLALFIDELSKLENIGDQVEITLVGIKPLIVFCDRSLLRLALCNGIKNAIEATLLTATEQHKPSIVISWGTTDHDCWISIIDNGPGLASDVNRSFTLGESSKSGHLGFGLGIAKQAIETLRGRISLSNSAAGGARYELRWSLNL